MEQKPPKSVWYYSGITVTKASHIWAWKLHSVMSIFHLHVQSAWGNLWNPTISSARFICVFVVNGESCTIHVAIPWNKDYKDISLLIQRPSRMNNLTECYFLLPISYYCMKKIIKDKCVRCDIHMHYWWHLKSSRYFGINSALAKFVLNCCWLFFLSSMLCKDPALFLPKG